MRNIQIFIALVIIVFTIGCKKQEDVSIDKIEAGEVNFSPMQIGNYWIYEVSTVDKDSNFTFKSIDSTFIAGIKAINGNEYYEYRSSSSAGFVQYLRDSSGYLVDEKGEKFMIANNFTDSLVSETVKLFGNIFSKTYRLMYKPSSAITTKAGAFDAVEARFTEEYPLVGYSYVAHAYYAPNIGLILRQDKPNASGKFTVYNLLRYQVE